MSDLVDEMLALSTKIKRYQEDDRRHQSMMLQISCGLIGDHWWIPRGKVFIVAGIGVVAHPATAMVLNNGGRMPLWTRHDRGVIEAERDRRRRG